MGLGGVVSTLHTPKIPFGGPYSDLKWSLGVSESPTHTEYGFWRSSELPKMLFGGCQGILLTPKMAFGGLLSSLDTTKIPLEDLRHV
jgi:hypothetical protein